MMRSLAKRLGTLLFFPFIVLLLPFIALGIGVIFVNAIVSRRIKRIRWLRRLRKNGRVIPATSLLTNTTGGTLIVDRPGFNFKATDCWWTKEDVSELSPVPVPTDEERIDLCTETKQMTAHEFDVWCWQRYISPDSGSATLVAPPRHGEAMSTRIREHLPDLRCVTSWSAVPAMESLAANATEPGVERELQ